MKALTLTFLINDNNCIKTILFDENETNMPSNSETLERLAITLLQVLKADENDLKIQDLLNELNISKSNRMG